MGNSAVDSLAQAIPAKDLKILEILDCDTGEFIYSRKFIQSHKYGEIFEPRHEIRARWKTEKPKYVCSDCNVAVSLLAGVDKNWFFFRHLIEDGRCAAKTRGNMSQLQINAIRYNCVAESEPHKRFKQMMYDCACADESFSDTKIEKVRTSTTEKGKWRKPDVSAIRNELLHAFEVQLSSTFFDVVLDRQAFYRDEGAILIWVLPDFSPNDTTMMEDDIFFHNNCNVMVLNEAIAAKSISEGLLHFGCWFRLPSADGATYSESWQYEVVPFDAVTLDIERQRAFYFDYETKKDAAKQLIAEFERQQLESKEKIERERIAEIHETNRRQAEIVDEADRKVFEEFWFKHGHHFQHTPENRARWREVQDLFEARGIDMPDFPDSDGERQSLLNGIYSAREGVPIGYGYKKLIQVAHQIAEYHPRLLVPFGHALKFYGMDQKLREQDVSKKWQERLSGNDDAPGLKARMKVRDPAISPDESLLPLLSFLFPDVAVKVNSYLDPAF
jgi:competence CoiA-like predicted nuclease